METNIRKALESNKSGFKQVAHTTCDPKQVIETAKTVVVELGLGSCRLYKKKLLVTSQSPSTEETWQTIVLEASPEFLKIIIPFTINSKNYEFPQKFLNTVIGFITKISPEVPIGYLKYNFESKSVSFECTALYIGLENELNSLITDYLKAAIEIYNSVVYGLVLITLDKTDVNDIVNICKKRKLGIINYNNSEAQDSSSGSDDNSDTENIDKNEISPRVKNIFSKDSYIQSFIRLAFDTENAGSYPFIIDSVKIYETELIRLIFEELKKIYEKGIEFKYFNIESTRIKFESGKIEFIILKNPQKMECLDNIKDEECDNYISRTLNDFNQQICSNLRSCANPIAENYQNYIIDPKKFQFPNITAKENIIGQGGFGIVYKNVLGGIPVAIKFPKSSNSSPKHLKKLIQEFRIIKELNHQNIIKAYGFVKKDDCYGIVLEQCLSGSLNTLKSNTSLNFKYKLEIMIKLIRALEYMHMKNICHFDIKPHNILLDMNMEPKITDLGLSKKVGENNEGKNGFTLFYCSPEQIKNHNPGKKADVWSFGMTLYSFLTGISPYDYLNGNGRKKMDKNEFYNEIYVYKRKPMLPEQFEIKYYEIANILWDAWKIDPNERSTATQVRKALVNYMRKL
jgi:Protein kinase domain